MIRTFISSQAKDWHNLFVSVPIGDFNTEQPAVYFERMKNNWQFVLSTNNHSINVKIDNKLLRVEDTFHRNSAHFRLGELSIDQLKWTADYISLYMPLFTDKQTYVIDPETKSIKNRSILIENAIRENENLEGGFTSIVYFWVDNDHWYAAFGTFNRNFPNQTQILVFDSIGAADLSDLHVVKALQIVCEFAKNFGLEDQPTVRLHPIQVQNDYVSCLPLALMHSLYLSDTWMSNGNTAVFSPSAPQFNDQQIQTFKDAALFQIISFGNIYKMANEMQKHTSQSIDVEGKVVTPIPKFGPLNSSVQVTEIYQNDMFRPAPIQKFTDLSGCQQQQQAIDDDETVFFAVLSQICTNFVDPNYQKSVESLMKFFFNKDNYVIGRLFKHEIENNFPLCGSRAEFSEIFSVKCTQYELFQHVYNFCGDSLNLYGSDVLSDSNVEFTFAGCEDGLGLSDPIAPDSRLKILIE